MNHCYININGKDVKLKFGMHCARYLSEKLQGHYCFDGDEITEIGIGHVLYAGYINACAVADAKADLSFEDFVDFIESSLNNPDAVNAISQAVKVWTEAQIKGNVNEEAKKKPLKKSKS